MSATSCNVRVLRQSAPMPDIRRLMVALPKEGPMPKAGQFYMLRAWAANESPVLSRPISVHDVDTVEGTLTFLYQIKGEGTQKLARLAWGQTLTLTGPCGNGFDVAGAAAAGRVAVVEDEHIAELGSPQELLARYGGAIDHLVIDALRVRPHGTHLSFEEALLCAARIGAVHTWLFHICHDMRHAQIMQYVSDICQKKPELRALTENGRTAAPAYDGLQLETC